jgi:hypothetical protein
VAYLPATFIGASVGFVCNNCRADGRGRKAAVSPCLCTLSGHHGCTFIIVYHDAGVPEMMPSRTYSSHLFPFWESGFNARFSLMPDECDEKQKLWNTPDINHVCYFTMKVVP